MEEIILNKLKEHRQTVEERYKSFVRISEMAKSKYISSKKFFFQVVFNHFDELSKTMVNKIINGSYYVFSKELTKALDKAEYVCKKPEREDIKNERMKYYEKYGL